MLLQVAGRLLLVGPVLFVVLLVTFVVIQFAAGDQARIYWRTHAGNMTPTPEQLAALREELGLDDPLVVQFFRWVGSVLRLDLGRTVWTNQPVWDELTARLPATLLLAGAALGLAVAVAVPLGVLSAARPGSWADAAARLFAISGISIPQFWLGLLLIYLLSFKWKLLPMMGSGSARHVVLPALTLALGPAAMLTRLVRASVLQTLGDDFVRSAYAKGFSEPVVLLKHVLRPALIPVVTLVGLQFGFLFGGAVVVETIFSWPGVGKWAVDGILHRDMPILRAFILVMGVIFVLANLVVDLAYAWLDPRIRPG
jgi:ABC-type dipeptide/oligopeptide/nickel transport system permease component